MVASSFSRGLILVQAAAWLMAASIARADIYQWTMTGGSVAQSGTLCPGGSNVTASPGADLSALDLTQAYLIGANLANANLSNTTLANADLTDANLTSASLFGADISQCQLDRRRGGRNAVRIVGPHGVAVL